MIRSQTPVLRSSIERRLSQCESMWHRGLSDVYNHRVYHLQESGVENPRTGPTVKRNVNG